MNNELLAANQCPLEYALLSAKRRQSACNRIMRVNAPYRVRLQAVALFGTKEGKQWP
ncbi:MAG: hypothetical protein OQK13_00395 [Gammaproteobacteria bacterium]|nr:hypothetical protein [Gammaproteobacteria bacterium]